jgi:hypothetical protein
MTDLINCPLGQRSRMLAFFFGGVISDHPKCPISPKALGAFCACHKRPKSVYISKSDFIPG